MAGTGYNQQQQQSSTHDHYQQIKHSYFHYTTPQAQPQQHSPVLLNDPPSSPLTCTPTHHHQHRTTVIGGSATTTSTASSASPWYPSSTMTTTDYDDSAFRDGIADMTQAMSNTTIDNDCNENNQHQSYENYGHFFVKKTFHKPTYCHHCVEMLWGLIGQGYYCEVCNFICHDRCRKNVISPCSSIAPILIKNPVCHIWSDVSRFKRKFCNVCRKRLEDFYAVRCEVCEYYAHEDCKDFAVNDCRETATYVPSKDNSTTPVRHHHHWREGNLPTNSKCAKCRKTCWSSECLAGMRCEWCGATTHSTCRSGISEECGFGTLKDIIIPPYAISIPRIADLNKDLILGIGNNMSKPVQNLSSSNNNNNNNAIAALESSPNPSAEPKGAMSITSQRSFNDLSKAAKRSSSNFVRRIQRQSSFVLPNKKQTNNANRPRAIQRGTLSTSP